MELHGARLVFFVGGFSNFCLLLCPQSLQFLIGISATNLLYSSIIVCMLEKPYTLTGLIGPIESADIVMWFVFDLFVTLWYEALTNFPFEQAEHIMLAWRGQDIWHMAEITLDFAIISAFRYLHG